MKKWLSHFCLQIKQLQRKKHEIFRAATGFDDLRITGAMLYQLSYEATLQAIANTTAKIIPTLYILYPQFIYDFIQIHLL